QKRSKLTAESGLTQWRSIRVASTPRSPTTTATRSMCIELQTSAWLILRTPLESNPPHCLQSHGRQKAIGLWAVDAAQTRTRQLLSPFGKMAGVGRATNASSPTIVSLTSYRVGTASPSEPMILYLRCLTLTG